MGRCEHCSFETRYRHKDPGRDWKLGKQNKLRSNQTFSFSFLCLFYYLLEEDEFIQESIEEGSGYDLTLDGDGSESALVGGGSGSGSDLSLNSGGLGTDYALAGSSSESGMGLPGSDSGERNVSSGEIEPSNMQVFRLEHTA